MSEQSFVKIFSLFLFAHFTKITITCVCVLLKFGVHIKGLKATVSIKFGINLINIQRVLSDFTHKAKLNFCHAYRVNCFEEQAEN